MLELGYDHINLDDCWGKRDPTTKRIMGDPTRFPEGMKSFIAKIHDLGFKFGLYTDIGTMGCHHPFVGSYGHYQQDADTFRDWEVDYVKFDGCNLPTNHTPEDLTCNMSQALNATGRDMWFNFHCWHSQTCATCGDSFRVFDDHHDDWDSTDSVIQFLKDHRQNYWGPSPQSGWPDPDFVYTGGQGCGTHSDAGKRCPGQTNVEYITEFSIWAIAGGQLVFATDPRNMTEFMKSVLFNTEVLSVFKDISGFQNIAVKEINTTEWKQATLNGETLATCEIAIEKQISGSKCVKGVSFGCNNENKTMWTKDGCRGLFTCDGIRKVLCSVDGPGTHVCPCVPEPPKPQESPQVWLRPLQKGCGAVVLFNPDDKVGHKLRFNFADMPNLSWNNNTRLFVRDLWQHEDLGAFTGSFTPAKDIPPHGVTFIKVCQNANVLQSIRV